MASADVAPPAPPYLGPPKYHSGTGNKRPGRHPFDRVVMHGTVTPCAPGWARRVAGWFRDGTVRGSCHYVVDPGEVFQAAYDDVVCWHAPPNPHTVGFELCDPVTGPITRWNDTPHRKMLKLAAREVAQFCLAYNVPIRWRTAKQLRAGGAEGRGITDHDEVSKAFGQSTHWDLGLWPRHRFIKMVRAEAVRLRGDEHAAKVEEAQAVTLVTRARDILTTAAKVARHPHRAARIRRGLAVLPPH